MSGNNKNKALTEPGPDQRQAESEPAPRQLLRQPDYQQNKTYYDLGDR
jgi:hypothetical protein